MLVVLARVEYILLVEHLLVEPTVVVLVQTEALVQVVKVVVEVVEQKLCNQQLQ
jgi:hypothetical protein